jgi:hypothetical protein
MELQRDLKATLISGQHWLLKMAPLKSLQALAQLETISHFFQAHSVHVWKSTAG